VTKAIKALRLVGLIFEGWGTAGVGEQGWAPVVMFSRRLPKSRVRAAH